MKRKLRLDTQKIMLVLLFMIIVVLLYITA